MAYMPNPRQAAHTQQRHRRSSGKWGALDTESTTLFFATIGDVPSEDGWKEVTLHDDLALTFIVPRALNAPPSSARQTKVVTLPKGKKIFAYFADSKLVRGYINDIEYERWNGQVTITVKSCILDDGTRGEQISMLHTAR